MLKRIVVSCLSIFLLFAIHQTPLLGQRSANSNAYYQQLRGLMPGGEIIAVSNLELRRDAGVFTFAKGSFAFYGAVNGKVTGAVFKGEGHLHITPPTAEERHNLSLVNHTEEFDEDFDEAVLRFGDDTAAELRKGSSGKGDSGANYAKAAQDLYSFSREKLHDNTDLRLLADVLSTAPGGYFEAAVHGKKNPHLIFYLDPHGVGELAPEEVALLNWKWIEGEATYPLAFHRTAEYAKGTASGNEQNAAYKILSEDLDVTIEKSGFLSAVAAVEVRAQQDGVAVVPLDLYSTLRVSKVESGKGDALDFVQEKKENDPDFGVVLAQPLKKGDVTTIKVTYGGKDVVFNEGGGNYYPSARENWHPSDSSGSGNYATYHMFFHVPKGIQLIATGNKLSEKSDGKNTTTEWKTLTPLALVGFNLGEFTSKSAQFNITSANGVSIDAYANTETPDFIAHFYANRGLGTMNTTPQLPNELTQGEAAAQIYTNYFGAMPFNHISLTQQAACDYGQTWPMLIFLPICGFFDDTQRHFLGLGDQDIYWKVVTPHEVAHQWWGQTVGFSSYRDQWMSEGFADASASIYLQSTRPKPDDFLDFWRLARKQLTEKNQFGFRPIDVGPVTMGYRLSSPKTGWSVYNNLVYPKGAYILHMVRMMMWTPQSGDERFKATMHDFLTTHWMQSATTEDFKAMVEKHMSPQMDLDNNQRMDWFFNQYVYGTELPAYHFESQLTPNDAGTSLHFKLAQSEVSANFKMMVPVYLELSNGKVMRMGTVPIVGDTTVERTVQLPKLPAAVKRVVINYYYDVLATES